MTERLNPAPVWWSPALRVLAATIGAFGVASLATVTLALLLPRLGSTHADAVTIAFLASSLIFAAISLSAFHARSGAVAWRGLLMVTLALSALAWLLRP